jgi:hypothetical protein
VDRSCTTEDGRPKRRYESRAEAKRAVRAILDQGTSSDPARIGTYRCPVCDYFHVGHYPASQRNRAALRARHHVAASEPAELAG